MTLNTGEFFGEALNPYLQAGRRRHQAAPADHRHDLHPGAGHLRPVQGGRRLARSRSRRWRRSSTRCPRAPRSSRSSRRSRLVKQLLAVKCEGGEDTCGVEIGSFTLQQGPGGDDHGLGRQREVDDQHRPRHLRAEHGSATRTSPARTPRTSSATPGTISKVKSLTAGLSIPVMEDPTILFELISGGDIPLVEFDSGPLSLGFQFQKSFGPIYAPPPVMMVIGGGASVTLRIAAGFDTYGIRRAIETGDGAQVLDSLYFKTVDNNGVPIPVVQFTGYLEAGASVSIGILEVGVVGGIKLTVGFYWNDPNSDGKFRLFEFGARRGQQPDLPVQRRGRALSLHQGLRRDRVQPVLGELRLHPGQHQAARLQPQARLHPAAAQAGRHPRAVSSTSSPASSAAPVRAATPRGTPTNKATRPGRSGRSPSSPTSRVTRTRRPSRSAASASPSRSRTRTTRSRPSWSTVARYTGNLTISFTGGSGTTVERQARRLHQDGRRVHRER